MNRKRSDIMENILTGIGTDFAAPVEELDCIIYKKIPGMESDMPEDAEKKIWKASQGDVSVQVWEDKAKIRVKASKKKRNISMERIAQIAVRAIVEELEKEE